METAISGSRDDIAARLTEIARRNSYETHLDDTWVSVHNPRLSLPDQGWKIHVAARPGTLAETLDRVLPVLLGADCDFKVVRSPDVLRKINSGDLDPGAVGKAVTVYPRQETVVDLGRALADATAGLAAPRVPSDRRVRRDAPVHYRYAPFVPQYRIDDNGDHELVLIGPDGERMPGAAGPEFRCPPWATDPFRPRTPEVPGNGKAARARRGGATLGGRYRLTSGVVRGARGNVYRAEDLATGERVVVKEARAYVGENTEGQDLRAHIRNERRVLLALAGLDGVPRLVDHFRHGEDEYLVITEAGTEDLNHHVNDHGVFADGGPRDLGDLASQLVRLLDAVHARGVVVRDLSPKNVVLDDTGRCTLVDFGNSRYDGTQIHGWTPGYSVPDQNTGRPSVPADDHYALGATLYFAATGMHPVCVDEDPFRNRERTLMCFAGRFPHAAGGVVGSIPRLLDLDPDVRAAAVAGLRAGRPAARGPRPSLPPVGPDLLASVVDHTRRECVRFAEAMMDDAPRRSAPPVTQVFKGSSGLGMELLHHEGTRAIAGELARWTARTAPDGGPPALFAGRTGTAVFLATARRLIGEDLPAPAAVAPGPSERDDYLHGLAGIGAGHLLLAELDPDLRPAHHATAAECARRLLAGEVAEGPEPPARPGTGMATASGFAHGATGVACFLLACHRATGDAEAGAAARERFDRLAAEAAELIGVMRSPSARPMSVSWCQGVGGIAAGLLYAAEAYGDERYLALASEGARACLAIAPQAWVVSQCCGLAGVGELLVDVALATDDEEFWAGAGHVAALILARSGGERDRPVFPDNTLESADGTWGTGTSGVLSFLRRLCERRGARLWTPWWTPPAAVG